MKKLILAFIAIAFAFALSSCCDQGYCPQNMRCNDAQQYGQDEPPYRFDGQSQVRQDRRW